MSVTLPLPDGLRIEYRPAAELTPYARNARTHSAEQVRQLTASIAEFGFVNPVLVDEDGVLIAGHGRVRAAQAIADYASGNKLVPTICLAHMTESQKRAYVLADNQLAMNAGWDNDLLAVELDELRDCDFDLGLIGFTTKDLDDLIGTPNIPGIGAPGLPTGGKGEIQTMTFTLHDDQAKQVVEAMALAKTMGDFGETGNGNSNGNALARICETFLTQNAISA